MLAAFFEMPVLAGIICLRFKRWRGEILHYTALGFAVLVILMYIISIIM